jgi:hypothetical protein
MCVCISTAARRAGQQRRGTAPRAGPPRRCRHSRSRCRRWTRPGRRLQQQQQRQMGPHFQQGQGDAPQAGQRLHQRLHCDAGQGLELQAAVWGAGAGCTSWSKQRRGRTRQPGLAPGASGGSSLAGVLPDRKWRRAAKSKRSLSSFARDAPSHCTHLNVCHIHGHVNGARPRLHNRRHAQTHVAAPKGRSLRGVGWGARGQHIQPPGAAPGGSPCLARASTAGRIREVALLRHQRSNHTQAAWWWCVWGGGGMQPTHHTHRRPPPQSARPPSFRTT